MVRRGGGVWRGATCHISDVTMGSGEQYTLNCTACHVHETRLSILLSMTADSTIEMHLV